MKWNEMEQQTQTYKSISGRTELGYQFSVALNRFIQKDFLLRKEIFGNNTINVSTESLYAKSN